MESLEDGTSHGMLDGLFDGILPGQEDRNVHGSSVGYSYDSHTWYEYGNLDSCVGIEVNN